MIMPKTRLALVGAGVIGKRHLKAIGEVGEAELVAISDTNAEAESLARDNEVPFFSSTEAMLSAQTPDGVLVCTPTEVHLQPVLSALKSKAHVLVEKPITASMEEAELIIRSSQECAREVLVGHHRRYYGMIQKVRELIRGGGLGQLIGVSGLWAVRKSDVYYEPDWRKQRSSGPVLINLIHEIDLLRYLCGELVSISAKTRRGLRSHPKEETAAVLLEFEDGAVGTFLLSDVAPSPWTWEQAVGENPDFPRSAQNVYRFIGSKAALDFPNLVLWQHEGRHRDWMHEIAPEPIAVEFEDAYVAQCRHFCAVINGTEQPRITALDAAKTLRATLAVFEAADKGTEIRLCDS